MRFLLLSLPAMLAMSLTLHAETAAIPLAVDANQAEFTTRVNENTGAVELQKADGSWQVVAIKTSQDSENELPIVKVYYPGYGYGYGGNYYGYGYDCPPGYIPPPPPPVGCCGGVVVPPPPVYYPAPVPQVYYGGSYYGPNGYWRGGGYRYHHWRRW